MLHQLEEIKHISEILIMRIYQTDRPTVGLLPKKVA